ncbi:MAG: T9SS type A sorting domain-containing protein [Bacteroidetes bacterium]|nr:T9SS type A sorting domain-containing protein [Bacteroidota bacterium]
MKTFYKPIFKISFVLFLLLNLSIQLQAAPLSGTYTINPNGSGSRNVKTFNDAVQLLKDSGVNGAVVFNVADGKYSEQVEIIDINGASATNNITFQSASNDSTKAVVDFKSFGGTSNYTLFLNRCKYFNFNTLTFMRSDSVNSKEGRVIQIFGSNNISFNGCKFLGIKTKTSTNTEVIRSIAGLPINKNISFKNSILRNGQYNILWLQKDTTILDSNIAFINNTFDSAKFNACSFNYLVGFKFSGNKVTFNSGSNTAILLYQVCGKTQITNNVIYSYGTGLHLNYCTFKKDSILVFNNMITSKIGITFQSSQSNNLHVYFNTFYSATATSSWAAYFSNAFGATVNTYFKNNNCISDSGFALGNQNGITQTNYNNLYTLGKYLVRWNSNDYASLAAYKFGASMDINSVSNKARFISSTDLHLNQNPNNIKLQKGAPISVVTTDIDGQLRNKFSPNIGADEIETLREISSISGKLFIDFNDNGLMDSVDYPLMHKPIKITTTANGDKDYLFTDDSGNYDEFIDTGKYSLTPPQILGIRKANPSSISISIKDSVTHIQNNNFSLVPDSTLKDLSIYGTSTSSSIRKWSKSSNLITAKNNSYYFSTTASIKIKSIKNLKIYSASIANTKNGDSILEVNLGKLKPQESKKFYLYLFVDSSAKIGDNGIFACSISPTEGDTNVDDNSDTIKKVITYSKDPNDKEVSDLSRSVSNKKPLTYTVRFQNTGNDVAYDVIVKDKLDASLNPESFSMITTSHPCKYKIVNKELVVTFSNINLPDSHANEPKSHGLFKYQITPYNISNGTKINNTAHIYFDYNAAVVTNTVSTLFLNTGIEESVLSGNNNIHLYPNPTTTSTTLEVSNLPQTNTTITIIDILGRQLMLLTQTPNAEGKLIKEIDVSALPKGMYFISVINEEMRVVSKLVVR